MLTTENTEDTEFRNKKNIERAICDLQAQA